MNENQSSPENEVRSTAKDEPTSGRRDFVASAAVLATALGAGAGGANAATGAETVGGENANQNVQRATMKLPSPHDQRKPVVAMLVHPGVTLLDLLGPQTVLAPSCDIHLVWKNTDLLETDSGIVMKASCSFDDCPRDLDVLFVPGGHFGVIRDEEVLRFLADRGRRAKYVTSVCGRFNRSGSSRIDARFQGNVALGCCAAFGTIRCNPDRATRRKGSQPNLRRRRHGGD